MSLAERRATLSDAKRDLIERRLQAAARAGSSSAPPSPPATPSIPLRRSRESAGPLTSAQQRMWYFHQLEPGSPVYHIPIAVRLTGNLQVPTLRLALAALVERHQVLRTRIVVRDGSPVHMLADSAGVDLPEHDLSAVPAAERESALRDGLRNETRRPFDLAKDNLVRCALFHLAAEVRVFLVVIHHIASDLMSAELFFRELAAIYSSGSARALPDLPLQYADYAAWEHAWAGGDGPAAQLTYWRNQLTGAPALLDLPTDDPRPATMSFRGALARRQLAAELVDELQTLSRREGATLFMTLLAAFQVLLGRLAQQSDVVVGIPTAGRVQPNTESLIGLFVNTLAIRTDLSADPVFRGLLHQIRETTLGALSHQEVPFDRVVEEVRPARGVGYTPLVQVMFTLQNAAASALSLDGVASSPVAFDPGTARFDLTLVAEQSASGLNLVLEYRTDLFRADTAARLLTQFEVLLEEVAADPDRAVSKLPLLGPAERQRLLVEWNTTQQEFAGPELLHQLVETQAAATPSRTAMIAGHVKLTYREIDESADQMARRLVALGVGPEARVAVFLSRGAALVPALLGILKCGGAYVPMDPAYPADRLAFVLQDSRAGVVVTERKLLPLLPAFGGPVVCVDDPAPGGRTGSYWAPVLAPRNLAYVIYTSGSTGKPKGVAIEHRNAVAFVRWAQTVFSARELDGVLAATSICFDLSVFELFVPLSCGGKIILAENALALAGHPHASEVRLVNTVPSAAAELLRSSALPASVETVNLAGEPLPQELVRRLYAMGIQRVYDLYGPTETTTYSTCALRTPDGPPSIGRPLANTQLYLLDRHLQPVPIGVTGELYIGGAGVARGYLDRPALTAERFIRNPFIVDPEARLYRTGDLCRYRADGSLEYLGRSDHQVKIRGFRVELGEVESALAAHPGLTEVCVVVCEKSPGDRRLVAYCTAGGQPPLVSDLRRWLQRTLPEPFVPSLYVFLPRLPRTANGKIDRRSLPAPETQTVPEVERVLPVDALERRVAAIWEEVLGVRPIGVNERFFDLGGHSLLAVRLTLRLEQQLGRKLPLAALLQAPTVGELAALLREAEAGSTTAADTRGAAVPTVLDIQPQGSRRPLFLVHGMGGGILWGYANLAPHLGGDQPVFGFQAAAPAPDEKPSIEAMAARYVAAMRRRQPRGPYRIGGYCFGGNVAYEMARQLERAGETVEALFLISSWPANSGHDRLRWTPAGLAGFAANLVRWCVRLLEWARRARAQFFRWKWQSLTARLRRAAGGTAPHVESEIGLLVDLAGIPEGERRLWAAHLQALNGYRPGPYSGPVTLLRTAAFPLICSFDPGHGWHQYARGGVTVRQIPGSHATVLSEPHVRGLARELQRQLA